MAYRSQHSTPSDGIHGTKTKPSTAEWTNTQLRHDDNAKWARADLLLNPASNVLGEFCDFIHKSERNKFERNLERPTTIKKYFYFYFENTLESKLKFDSNRTVITGEYSLRLTNTMTICKGHYRDDHRKLSHGNECNFRQASSQRKSRPHEARHQDYD